MYKGLKVDTIKAYIRDNGLTKKEFGKQCNISPVTLNKILRAENCNMVCLFRVAKRMNVRICELFE